MSNGNAPRTSVPDTDAYAKLTMDDGSDMPITSPTMGDIIASRFGRREMMKGLLAATAITAVSTPLTTMLTTRAEAQSAGSASAFRFTELGHGVDANHHVAPGYNADVLIRWGDAVTADAPAFDPANVTAASQAKQFGYNCDFTGVIPLPGSSDTSNRALLCVNHEYTQIYLMVPGLRDQQEKDVRFKDMTKDLVELEMAAHGGTVVEIVKQGGKWSVVKGSQYNRRITADTPMRISGPAAGHNRMKTSYDASGAMVRGMINNCAGGISPWGTFLTAEENFNNYFSGKVDGHKEEANYKSYGIPGGEYAWGTYVDRFDLNKEENEPNRFGWIVEIDPYDANSTPVKRTALGRFKHEGAETIVNSDGRVVVYSGDDERFAFVYKFVTAGRYNATDRAANFGLLDSGTLYVAKYTDDGKGEWMPMVFGQGPLTAANGFNSQADVVIETRKAARLLGATPMDRPEDVEANKRTNKVYVMLTNNDRRQAAQLDKANDRAGNLWGQVLEMTPAGNDHAATAFTWEILVKGGDPKIAEVGAMWNPATTANGWFACPDGCAIDHQGRLWITTDQGGGWKKASGRVDGVYALDTEGAARGTSKLFYRVPVGAEMTGLSFASDDQTAFVAVQHPAADGTELWEAFGKKSTYAEPATRWPDFDPKLPTRPSVVAITKTGGGVIGS